ncbi:MAG: sulfate ABC transporter permease subunit [Lachnospiraceae bacterium]|nr:sulfate ABC transporter permease subunit [Lachnospiraceae bacterium]
MERQNKNESTVLKWVLIIIAAVFLFIMVIMPLGMVVAGSFAKGLKYYIASITDKYTLKALLLTLRATIASVICTSVFGLIAAWAVTRYSFPGKKIIKSIIDIPVTISPVICGMIFLLLFGRQGLIYPILNKIGIDVIFAVPGIIIVTVFVTLPMVFREIVPVLEARGTEEEEAAAMMGASGWTIFTRITFPSIKWPFIYGMILSASRAMGEFGAVSVISGHLRGLTNTLPLHVEMLFNEFNTTEAFAVSSVLVILSIALLILRLVLQYISKKKIQKIQEVTD